MKKLIIVCEDKLRHYGDFLSQLISRNDDTTEEIIGIKDGAVAAQVWTEKEYSGNAAQISSEQYILFIGNSKLIKEKRTYMQRKYSEYGMNYGWLGKQAVLFIDRVVSLEEYDEFFQLANEAYRKGKQSELSKLLERRALPAISDSDVIDVDDNDSLSEPVTEDEAPLVPQKKSFGIIGQLESAKAAIRRTTDYGRNAFYKASDNINKATKSKSIEEQEYSCAIILFYLHGLSAFLGLNEE